MMRLGLLLTLAIPTYAAAQERVCDDGIDNDNDMLIDCRDPDCNSDVYLDADGDGYGDPRQGLSVCGPVPPGFVLDGSDCDDTNIGINPGIPEIISDEVDQNCDGLELCYVDSDRDGAGSRGIVPSLSLVCTGRGISWHGQDCDDGNAFVRPGEPDVPGDGLDNDCNGIVDDRGLHISVSPLREGQFASVGVSGGSPNSFVYLGYSLYGIGPGRCPVPLAGACLDIFRPQILAVLTPDQLGTASVSGPLPALGVDEVAFQAGMLTFGGGILSNTELVPVE